jgi:hypothetical protein
VTRPAWLLAGGLGALALGGGIAGGLVHTGPQATSGRARPADRVSGSRVAPAHGLMLFPLADPDAHVHNGAESIDTAH